MYHRGVRYLRMLLNSVLAGGLVAAYLTLLFLQLNPAVEWRFGAVAPLASVLFLSYGVHAAAVFYAALVLWQVFSADVLSPGWVSVRVLAWLCATAAGAGAALMWLNLRGLRGSLDADGARRMALGAAVLTLCAGALLVLALVRRSVRPSAWRVGAALLGCVLVASVAVPMILRGPGGTTAPSRSERAMAFGDESTEDDQRIMLLLIDGASLDFISPAAADGRLPNFGRLLDQGSVMHLATLRPTQPAPVWTAVATGKLPARNGVRSASTYRVAGGGLSLDLLPDYCLAHGLVYLGLLQETPHASSSLRARTLWDILGEAGVMTAVVRWPLTYPARPVNGVLVSDELHRAVASGAGPREEPATYPGELAPTLLSQLDSLPGDPVPVAGLDVASPYPGIASLAVDRFYAEVFEHVRREHPLQFMALRYQGLDTIGHYFLREAMPRVFGDVSEDERRQFGRVLEQYYRYMDDEVGKAIGGLDEDDLLLVVSPFGMEPVSLPKRTLERLLGSSPLSGTHERAPDGFLIAYGRPVRPGRLPRASVVDVTPTVLYFFGLAIGRDMDGYARTDIFTREFTEERPLALIPTYER